MKFSKTITIGFFMALFLMFNLGALKVFASHIVTTQYQNQSLSLSWNCPKDSFFVLSKKNTGVVKRGGCGSTTKNETHQETIQPPGSSSVTYTYALVILAPDAKERISTEVVNVTINSSGNATYNNESRTYSDEDIQKELDKVSDSLKKEVEERVGTGKIVVTSPDFPGEFTNIGEYIVAVLTKVIPLVIAGAVLVIVYAGFRYISSFGSPEATGQAKNLIEGAVLGILTLFLIGLIWAILIDTSSTTKREEPAPEQPIGRGRSH